MNNYEERLSFINDDILRKNLAQVFQHVAELALVLEEKEIELKEFLRKTILIQTASIVESLIYYFLIRKNIWETSSECWKYKSIKKIYSISDSEEAVGCIRKKEPLTKYTKFQHMIDACKNYGLFSEKEADTLAKIRESRNKIHLHSLDKVDAGISQKELENTFSAARLTINKVKENLK